MFMEAKQGPCDDPVALLLPPTTFVILLNREGEGRDAFGKFDTGAAEQQVQGRPRSVLECINKRGQLSPQRTSIAIATLSGVKKI